MGGALALDQPAPLKPDRVAAHVGEQPGTPAEQHRLDMDVEFVRPASRNAWSATLVPPPMYTSLSPAAAFARVIAASTPGTKVNVVAPATRTCRGRCVTTKTGLWRWPTSPPSSPGARTGQPDPVR